MWSHAEEIEVDDDEKRLYIRDEVSVGDMEIVCPFFFCSFPSGLSLLGDYQQNWTHQELHSIIA
jgi:hypothetical protein